MSTDIKLKIQERVFARHPDITEGDIRNAWLFAIAQRRRNASAPDVIAAAGPDMKGRLIEILAVEGQGGELSVYHAMKLTKKMARELNLIG